MRIIFAMLWVTLILATIHESIANYSLCLWHSNVNSSQYPLLLSRVSYSLVCPNFILPSENPFLCKVLVSSVFLQFTLVHNKWHWTSGSSSWLFFSVIKVTSWLYSKVWKCFMLRPQRELNNSNKANLTVEGHRLDNYPVPSMPWRPYTNLCFFLL